MLCKLDAQIRGCCLRNCAASRAYEDHLASLSYGSPMISLYFKHISDAESLLHWAAGKTAAERQRNAPNLRPNSDGNERKEKDSGIPGARSETTAGSTPELGGQCGHVRVESNAATLK